MRMGTSEGAIPFSAIHVQLVCRIVHPLVDLGSLCCFALAPANKIGVEMKESRVQVLIVY